MKHIVAICQKDIYNFATSNWSDDIFFMLRVPERNGEIELIVAQWIYIIQNEQFVALEVWMTQVLSV